MRRDPHWLDQDWCVWLELDFADWVVLPVTGFPVTHWNPWICLIDSMENEMFQSLSFKNRECKLASIKIISDSVKQCDSDVCFLHIPHIDTHVGLPNIHKST